MLHLRWKGLRGRCVLLATPHARQRLPRDRHFLLTQFSTWNYDWIVGGFKVHLLDTLTPSMTVDYESPSALPWEIWGNDRYSPLRT